GLPNNHPDRFAVSIMLNILGVGMSSRLFVEVREKRGLAYMVRAGSSSYRDVGVSYIQAGLDPARLGEALQVIKGEVMRMATEPITKQELADAKTSLAGRLALSLEDSSAQAEWFAKQAMFNTKIETPDDILRAFNKVTVKQVRETAARLLRWDEMRLAAIGPFTKKHIMKLVP
ncbi:MAG: insulinase family protein, partial [Candidatus Magasanikbacteria bacterium]|nr:insulinase family protein [Candidatus Magasanikbacteria bacterium]